MPSDDKKAATGKLVLLAGCESISASIADILTENGIEVHEQPIDEDSRYVTGARSIWTCSRDAVSVKLGVDDDCVILVQSLGHRMLRRNLASDELKDEIVSILLKQGVKPFHPETDHPNP